MWARDLIIPSVGEGLVWAELAPLSNLKALGLEIFEFLAMESEADGGVPQNSILILARMSKAEGGAPTECW